MKEDKGGRQRLLKRAPIDAVNYWKQFTSEMGDQLQIVITKRYEEKKSDRGKRNWREEKTRASEAEKCPV